MNEVWGVLGIEPTTDKRKIKKAYAEAVKRCHPEEHPEEFKELYNAYQAALGRASADNSPPRPEELQPEAVQQETAQISQSLQTLQSKAPQQETPHLAAMQPDSCQKTEEEPDAARAAIHRKFAQNDEKKRRALDQLTILWDAYLAKRNRRNTEALIRFTQGTEFACIRDLEPVMLMCQKTENASMIKCCGRCAASTRQRVQPQKMQMRNIWKNLSGGRYPGHSRTNRRDAAGKGKKFF